jgi:hypothetical protein
LRTISGAEILRFKIGALANDGGTGYRVATGDRGVVSGSIAGVSGSEHVGIGAFSTN